MHTDSSDFAGAETRKRPSHSRVTRVPDAIFVLHSPGASGSAFFDLHRCIPPDGGVAELWQRSRGYALLSAEEYQQGKHRKSQTDVGLQHGCTRSSRSTEE